VHILAAGQGRSSRQGATGSDRDIALELDVLAHDCLGVDSVFVFSGSSVRLDDGILIYPNSSYIGGIRKGLLSKSDLASQLTLATQ